MKRLSMKEAKDKLFSIYERENAIKQSFGVNTFLSVIGRSFDEDLISRIVAYSLSIDKVFVKNLFALYFEKNPQVNFDTDVIFECDTNVVCEKFMGKGRADIFVELIHGDEKIATLTIENKIHSWEHDDQTQTYYDWVIRNYKTRANAFFYLRPAFNTSKAVCNHYINITYNELLSYITADDYITNDFKLHINKKLSEMNMKLNNDQIEIMNNLDDFESLIASTKKKYKNLQKSLLDKVDSRLSDFFNIAYWKDATPTTNILKEVRETNTLIGSYRLYREDWYSENEYYFYVEIKFYNGKLDKIAFQQTVKSYSSSKNSYGEHINKIIQPEAIEIDGDYYVISKEEFHLKNASGWFDNEWENEFVDTAVSTLKRFIEELDKKSQNFISLINNSSI